MGCLCEGMVGLRVATHGGSREDAVQGMPWGNPCGDEPVQNEVWQQQREMKHGTSERFELLNCSHVNNSGNVLERIV